jgi:amino acid adenylation domain-containing protein
VTTDPVRAAAGGDPLAVFEAFPEAAIEQPISARFEEQVRRFESRPALECDSSVVSYRDLDREADRIAHQIVASCGAGDGRVALIFRSVSSLVPALLGVLKAGKVYVPVDPSYPASRIRTILEDSGSGLVLTDDEPAAIRALVPESCPVSNVAELPRIAPEKRLSLAIAPDAIATLLYTSGSTGTPKGVMQSHRNLLQHVRNYTNNLGIRSDERISLLFSYGFSASLLDIFGALLNGATLCPFDVRSRGAASLARWVAEARITHLHMVPSLYRKFASELTGRESLQSLRRLDLAGEPLYDSDVAVYRRLLPQHCSLVYRFAASEASFITHHEIGPGTPVAEGAVPAGRPADGMQILIQDEEGRDLGTGSVGEIVLRSAYLCPGYWRRPDLTAGVFSTDPDDGSLRRYRTGDLGRLLPDGVLEHVGRADRRVKIRGFTVELSEVEAALRRCEGVRDAVVVAREERRATAELAAFVVPHDGVKLARSAVRVALLGILPAYMVPAVVIPTPALPLTATGKVDHRALSALRSDATAGGGPPLAPRDDLESALARIWREELKLETLGVLDDFFALGGDSLTAVQIVTRIESELGRSVPSSILYLAPTVEALATRLRTVESVQSESLAHPFRVHGSKPPLFAVPGRGGDPIVFAYLANNLDPDRPFYGLTTPGLSHEQPIPQSFEELAAVHLAAIRQIQPAGPYFLLGLSSGAMVAFELARQIEQLGETVAFLGSLDGWAPGYPRPASGRSWFQRLADLGPGRSVILLRRTSAGAVLKQVLKDLGREAACRAREALGKPVSRTQRYRRIKRTHSRERTRYCPDPLKIRVTLFRAADPGIPDQYRRAPLYGWDGFAEKGVDVHDFPGVHDDLVYEPTVCLVAKRLDECMGKSGPSTGATEQAPGQAP